MKKEIKIITPTGMLGYGVKAETLIETCDAFDPDYIIADSGSTDSGPHKLAFGSTTVPHESYVRDWSAILSIAHAKSIPVLIGSAGGAGLNSHVDLFLKIVQDISAERGYSFKVATICSEIEKEVVVQLVEKGVVLPCGPVPTLTVEETRRSTNIVSQMGAEPYLEALKAGAQIIIGGRAYDPAPYAAVAIMHGFDTGIAWHMGKISECGALCGTPKSRTLLATVRKDSFDLEPADPASRCTTLSVAAHTLYEKSRPDKLTGPGGILELQEAKYEQLTERKVRVTGSIFTPMPYTVKLEGAKKVGFRTVFLGGIRDPIMIDQIDQICSDINDYTFALVDHYNPESDKIAWHVYGKNGIMGSLESESVSSFEICVVGEVLSSTLERAKQIASNARVALLHTPYPGQLATAANVALPFAPFELTIGEFSEFNVYHIIPVEDPLSLYPITYHNLVNQPRPAEPIKPIGKSSVEMDEGKGKQLALAQARAARYADAAEGKYKKYSLKELTLSGVGKVPLAKLASVVRSKNAGPYEVTFDVIFDNMDMYNWVKSTGVLVIDNVAAAYRIPVDTIVYCAWWEPAMAFKFTIPRERVQGAFGERDMFGAQQHIPLFQMEIPLPSHVNGKVH